ncbi:MAG: SpoIID/LytB domain-containing protein [Bacteroidales bacterium]|jgi:stage II sporulation protein D|nr:SpoIID/LytB domain-containing protein [Bacteroidales bacterium]
MLLLCSNLHGRSIWVSLYNSLQVRSVVVSAYNGPLIVSVDGGVQYTIAAGQAVYATLCDGGIWISNMQGQTGSFKHVTVQGVDSSAIVRLRPVSPQAEARNYEEAVSLAADIDRIQLINRVDEERYIAGVIEAEAGQGRAREFYKAKAIICRTYLYGHIDRHENEGFHLCDEVHCQAYKGQCRGRNILPAVAATQGIILTDRKDSKPILATFHSNCGGETESAQNAWQNNLPYLAPVADPYCSSSSNARWQKTVSLDDWISYLVKNGYKLNPDVVTDFSFQQLRRIPNYTVNKFTMPVRQIRTDWQLRSTFFSIAVEDGNVLFRGRGYGHGVGLCQEGAMEMARRGFKYGEIISFYYKNVNLVPVNTLQIRVPEFD